MEILYPDVIGSGGAPKRILKPRKRPDGQPGDEPEMPGTGVLNLKTESTICRIGRESPVQAPSSSGMTPNAPANASSPGFGTHAKTTSTALPPRTASAQPSVLTPPEELASQSKKRALPPAQAENTSGTTPTPPPPASIKSDCALPTTTLPDKRQRRSVQRDSVHPSSSCGTDLPAAAVASTPSCVRPAVPLTRAISQTASRDSIPETAGASIGPRWSELALEQFFKDFADENMDLQIRIAETVLVNENKALVYCKMPWCLKQYWLKKLDESFRKSP